MMAISAAQDKLLACDDILIDILRENNMFQLAERLQVRTLWS